MQALTLNEYAHLAAGTRRSDYDTFKENVCHPAIGLAGEVGEVLDLLKKPMFSNRPDLKLKDQVLSREDLLDELGDVMFYLVWIADLFAINPDDILEHNLDKLTARYQNGTPEEK